MTRKEHTIDRLSNLVGEDKTEPDHSFSQRDWENVAYRLQRIEVDNGILYKTWGDTGVAMTFVPYRDNKIPPR